MEEDTVYSAPLLAAADEEGWGDQEHNHHCEEKEQQGPVMNDAVCCDR